MKPLLALGTSAVALGAAAVASADAAPLVSFPTYSYSFTGGPSSWTWTGSQTANFEVVALGAQGGSANPGQTGGYGAYALGKFVFVAGQTINISVGGQGGSGRSGGGGGGGTFISSGGALLLVAGGGGGIGSSSTATSPGSASKYGYFGSGTNTSTPGATHNSGYIAVGGEVSAVGHGAGGGGYFGDGNDDTTGSNGGFGGKAWINGLAGGAPYHCEEGAGATGGYGGGGGACFGGGGGGGYSGGGGGDIAGGGGSMISGSAYYGFVIPGARAGSGYAEIIFQSYAAATPEPATLGLLGAGLAGLGLLRRRRGLLQNTEARPQS